MKFTLKYTKDNMGQINLFAGSVNHDDFINAYKARFSDLEKFKNLRYIISDFTDVSDFDVSIDTVKILSSIANTNAKYNRNLYVAGVHPRDLIYGLGRMWQAYSDDDTTGWVTKSFRERHEAEKWLQSEIGDHLRFDD